MTRKELIELAREQYQEEGTIEIDDDAQVSDPSPSGGTYVQAWVWVSEEEEDNGRG